MKRSIVAVVAISILAATTVAMAEAPKTNAVVGFHAQIEKDVPYVPIIDAFVTRRAWGQFGVSAEVAVTKSWGEGYAGPTYAPADWVELWLAAGGQQHEGKISPRYGGSIWLGGGEEYPLESLIWIEADDSLNPDAGGLWYDATTYYKPVSWVSLGVHGRHKVGFGPSAQVKLPVPELPIVLWATWTAWDPSGYEHASLARGLVGAKALF